MIKTISLLAAFGLLLHIVTVEAQSVAPLPSLTKDGAIRLRSAVIVIADVAWTKMSHDCDKQQRIKLQHPLRIHNCLNALDSLDQAVSMAEKLNSNPEFLAHLPAYRVEGLDYAARLGWTKRNGQWANDDYDALIGKCERFRANIEAAEESDHPKARLLLVDFKYECGPISDRYQDLANTWEAVLGKPQSSSNIGVVTAADCLRIQGNIERTLAVRPAEEPTEVSFFEVECGSQSAANSQKIIGWRASIKNALSAPVLGIAEEKSSARDDEPSPVELTALDDWNEELRDEVTTTEKALAAEAVAAQRRLETEQKAKQLAQQEASEKAVRAAREEAARTTQQGALAQQQRSPTSTTLTGRDPATGENHRNNGIKPAKLFTAPDRPFIDYSELFIVAKNRSDAVNILSRFYGFWNNFRGLIESGAALELDYGWIAIIKSVRLKQKGAPDLRTFYAYGAASREDSIKIAVDSFRANGGGFTAYTMIVGLVSEIDHDRIGKEREEEKRKYKENGGGDSTYSPNILNYQMTCEWFDGSRYDSADPSAVLGNIKSDSRCKEFRLPSETYPPPILR